MLNVVLVLFNIAFIYLAILLYDALLLMTWSFYNKALARKRQGTEAKSALQARRMMLAFEVSRTMFERLQHNNVVTIFHDDFGDIESIRTGSPLPDESWSLSNLPQESFFPTQWDDDDDAYLRARRAS